MQEMGQPNQVVIQEPRELAVIHEDQGPDVNQEQNVQRKVSMTTRVVKAVFLFWLDILHCDINPPGTPRHQPAVNSNWLGISAATSWPVLR